jgi:DNA recombination protein RmuC
LQKSPDADTPLLLLQQHVEALRQQVDERLKDGSQILQKSQEQVAARLDNAAKVVGDLQGKLGKLEEANTRLFEVGKDLRSLQEILKSPKLRGSLGEFFLADLLAQILPVEHYKLQHAFRNNEKVDAAILLGERWVPVDAKFPLENFQKYLQAQSEEEKKALKKLFVTDVRKHVDAIAQKYIKPDEGTFEFALMYIPAENVYYETIVKDQVAEGEHILAHYAMKRKVIPVSPNTLYVYLHTIALGLKGLKVEKAAQEILAGLARLGGDLGRIQENFRKVGLHLHNAQGAFEDADGRLGKFGDKMERLHGGVGEIEAGKPGGEDEKIRLLNTPVP